MFCSCQFTVYIESVIDEGDIMINFSNINRILKKKQVHKRRRVGCFALISSLGESNGMNNGDEGGITSLIKLIRQNKTKEQKMENVALNPPTY